MAATMTLHSDDPIACRFIPLVLSGSVPSPRAHAACSYDTGSATVSVLGGIGPGAVPVGVSMCQEFKLTAADVHVTARSRAGLPSDATRVYSRMFTVTHSGSEYLVLVGNTMSDRAPIPIPAEDGLNVFAATHASSKWQPLHPSFVSDGKTDLIKPLARIGFAAAARKSRIFVFGGCIRADAAAALPAGSCSEEPHGEVAYSNEFMYLSWATARNVTTPQWKHFASAAGRPPPPRAFAQMGVVELGPRYCVLIHGGLNQTGILNDVHVLDLKSQAWSTAMMRGPPLQARCMATAAVVDAHGRADIIIFGGCSAAGARTRGSSPSYEPEHLASVMDVVALDVRNEEHDGTSVVTCTVYSPAWPGVAGDGPSARAGTCITQLHEIPADSAVANALRAAGSGDASAKAGMRRSRQAAAARDRPAPACDAFFVFGGQHYAGRAHQPSKLLNDAFILQVSRRSALAHSEPLASPSQTKPSRDVAVDQEINTTARDGDLPRRAASGARASSARAPLASTMKPAAARADSSAAHRTAGPLGPAAGALPPATASTIVDDGALEHEPEPAPVEPRKRMRAASALEPSELAPVATAAGRAAASVAAGVMVANGPGAAGGIDRTADALHQVLHAVQDLRSTVTHAVEHPAMSVSTTRWREMPSDAATESILSICRHILDVARAMQSSSASRDFIAEQMEKLLSGVRIACADSLKASTSAATEQTSALTLLSSRLHAMDAAISDMPKLLALVQEKDSTIMSLVGDRQADAMRIGRLEGQMEEMAEANKRLREDAASALSRATVAEGRLRALEDDKARSESRVKELAAENADLRLQLQRLQDERRAQASIISSIEEALRRR